MKKNTIQPIDAKALLMVRACRGSLTAHQYKTLRGQVLAGDPDGAMKGLRKIMNKEGAGAGG